MEPGPGTMLTATLRLERELGRGGMGSVWRARHLGLGADVAVKLVAPELLRDEVIRERFAREARAAAHIRSPHVVAILDFGTSADGTPYITMDLCQGETLRRRLARLGRLEPRAAVRVVAGVTLGLEAAHALGIVHRDIKPENVLFDGPDDTVKLLDFGIAKRSDTGERILTMADAVMGTPAYMSPEQVLFPGKVEPAFDLWAVGVVAYEMLTGVSPFGEAA
ncbi:MAG: serine/threonine protein kinase, partial [Polyangiaceae bacterium]|nr:serine/threonine protein kinase [Polyangiaceae bacterium]